MKNPVLILVFISSSMSIGAQSIELDVKSFPAIWNNASFENFYGGSSISFSYFKLIREHKIGIGLEVRSINWGNQIALSIPYNHSIIRKQDWNVSANLSPAIGLALFYEKPLFLWSIEYLPKFEWTPGKKFNYFLGIGMRYSHIPEYKKYGQINQVLEFPICVGIKLNLRRNQND